MRRSERAAQARRELDRKFATVDLGAVAARPRSGWIRAVRNGLGMSQQALATRLGVSKASVSKLEASEMNETISLGKLAGVARAMDCQLVYALIPNTSLEHTVTRQAEHVAATMVSYVATTMELEDQAVEHDRRAEQLTTQARRVIAENRQWTGG